MFFVSTELVDERVVASVSRGRMESPRLDLVPVWLVLVLPVPVLLVALLEGFPLRGIAAAQLLMPDRNFSPLLLPLEVESLRE